MAEQNSDILKHKKLGLSGCNQGPQKVETQNYSECFRKIVMIRGLKIPKFYLST